jgi:hypothetical protein
MERARSDSGSFGKGSGAFSAMTTHA